MNYFVEITIITFLPHMHVRRVAHLSKHLSNNYCSASHKVDNCCGFSYFDKPRASQIDGKHTCALLFILMLYTGEIWLCNLVQLMSRHLTLSRWSTTTTWLGKVCVLGSHHDFLPLMSDFISKNEAFFLIFWKISEWACLPIFCVFGNCWSKIGSSPLIASL